MKAPRTAHWLLVPTLTLGMAMAPAQIYAAPAKPSGDAAPKDGAAKGKAGEAPKADEAPKAGEAAPKAGEAAPKAGEAAPKAGEAAPKAGKAPKRGAGDAPTDAADETPPDDAEAEPGASPDGDPTATPAAGTTPEAGTPSTEPEPEPEPVVETPPEPEITVQPRPVEPALETSPPPGGVASREAVSDPRRLRADDRILFRAGILSLGVAAAAVVPTVIGFQQAYVAHEDDDAARERTMRGLGIGAGVAAGTYAITGVVLVALGARQRRALVAPAAGPGQLGLVLRARF